MNSGEKTKSGCYCNVLHQMKNQKTILMCKRIVKDRGNEFQELSNLKRNFHFNIEKEKRTLRTEFVV